MPEKPDKEPAAPDDDVVSGVDQKRAKRPRPAADQAVAVSEAKLEDLLDAAEKHAGEDPELAAAILHFRPAE